MKLAYLIFLFLLFNSTKHFAQNILPDKEKKGLQFKIGSSLTYIWNSDSPFHSYREFTWNTNIAFSYFRKLWFGVQVLPILTRREYATAITKRNYTISGLFFQYNFIDSDILKVYGETSINYGNYCTCGNDDPYRLEELFYLGIGAGFQFPMKFISDKLSFEFAFFNYVILNKIQFKYNYTQYILGINYTFGDI